MSMETEKEKGRYPLISALSVAKSSESHKYSHAKPSSLSQPKTKKEIKNSKRIAESRTACPFAHNRTVISAKGKVQSEKQSQTNFSRNFVLILSPPRLPRDFSKVKPQLFRTFALSPPPIAGNRPKGEPASILYLSIEGFPPLSLPLPLFCRLPRFGGPPIAGPACRQVIGLGEEAAPTIPAPNPPAEAALAPGAGSGGGAMARPVAQQSLRIRCASAATSLSAMGGVADVLALSSNHVKVARRGVEIH